MESLGERAGSRSRLWAAGRAELRRAGRVAERAASGCCWESSQGTVVARRSAAERVEGCAVWRVVRSAARRSREGAGTVRMQRHRASTTRPAIRGAGRESRLAGETLRPATTLSSRASPVIRVAWSVFGEHASACPRSSRSRTRRLRLASGCAGTGEARRLSPQQRSSGQVRA